MTARVVIEMFYGGVLRQPGDIIDLGDRQDVRGVEPLPPADPEPETPKRRRSKE